MWHRAGKMEYLGPAARPHAGRPVVAICSTEQQEERSQQYLEPTTNKAHCQQQAEWLYVAQSREDGVSRTSERLDAGRAVIAI